MTPARRSWLATRCGALAGLVLLALRPGLATAVMPAAYAPRVVEPQIDGERWTFDLRPAQAEARRLGKRLYVYLGAHDCPYCRRYEAFLAANAAELLPHFQREWIVVELRSALAVNERRLVLRSERHHLPYAEFQRAIGDQRARLLVYPSVWVMDADAKPLMQMPAGAGTFQTVAEQLEILRLEE